MSTHREHLELSLSVVDGKLSALIGNERHQNRIIDPLLDERNDIVERLALLKEAVPA